MDSDLKRQIIIDHYKYPRNKGLISNNLYKTKHQASDSCIDDLTIAIKIEDNLIKDIKFDGVGCAISTASTSIFTELLKGKTRSEAIGIINNYINMVNGKNYDEEILEELLAFNELNRQANRIKCGLIGVNAIKELIEND